ncbi:MAG: hypothetical protein RL757_987 [Bacteroidota bacterium]|jgi:hypothetical protein
MSKVNLSTIENYLSCESSFLVGVLPQTALALDDAQVIEILEKKLGDNFTRAFDPTFDFPSPVAHQTNGTWLRHANIVGINVRTIGSFWNIIKYNLTLADAQNSIHLLPIWEPGVVASLYGMSSWQLNTEFFSPALRDEMPSLDTVEKQMKICVNILHALGKTVGMDVIPHTDRFSEQALANPRLFEWLRRKNTQIVEHGNKLHERVETLIFNYLQSKKSLNYALPKSKTEFFSTKFPEERRLEILFGNPHNFMQRLQNREEIIAVLYAEGLETVPATMGPPYRGIKIDTSDAALTTDEKGRTWRDFLITEPQPFSRVFNPLARYKLYENKNDNQNWELDFDAPLTENWEYVATHYAQMQTRFGFDFMRGDMAHVQPRPQLLKKIDGKVPPQYQTDFYDILGFIKQKIAKNAPYFGSYAETFLAPPDKMAYGDECDHLEYAHADATLGDLQSTVVGSERFLTELEKYLTIAETRTFAPTFAMMTADKDDPRFDEFYQKGNETRFFFGNFVTDLPSYMSLGFECRDPHFEPADNEFYTKLYVFLEKMGPKSVKSAYRFGRNDFLFENLEATKFYLDEIFEEIKSEKTHWLLKPNAQQSVAVWTQQSAPNYIFVVNFDLENAIENVEFSFKFSKKATPQYAHDFSTIDDEKQADLQVADQKITLARVRSGEGLAFKLQR